MVLKGHFIIIGFFKPKDMFGRRLLPGSLSHYLLSLYRKYSGINILQISHFLYLFVFDRKSVWKDM